MKRSISESGPGRVEKLTTESLLGMLSLIVLLQIAFFSHACAAQGSVYRVSDGKTISFGEMVAELRESDLIFAGEVHDVHAHHGIQFEIIRRMHAEPGIRTAVALEMFTAESQEALDRWTGGLLSLNDFLEVYYKDWNFPWTLYKDIFLYARDEQIPLVGLNIPREITSKVAEAGFGALTDKELESLPPDIGCAVDEDYMKFIRRAHAMHGHAGKQFVYFCQAQLLWDQVMARGLVSFLEKKPGTKVVVVTGNGHAWKGGIPEQVSALSKDVRFTVVLPAIKGYIEPGIVKPEDADYIVFP